MSVQISCWMWSINYHITIVSLPFTTILLHSFCHIIALITSNNQRLQSAGSLSFAKMVMMSSAPAKCASDARYASKDPFICWWYHTILTPICIRSAFFLHQMQLSLYSHLFKFTHHIQSLILQLTMDDVSSKTRFAPNSVSSMLRKKNFKKPTKPKAEKLGA